MTNVNSIIKSLCDYEERGTIAIQELTNVTLELARAKEIAESKKADAIAEGNTNGALDGKNADERKVALTVWLSTHMAYQETVAYEKRLESDKVRLSGDVDAIKFGAGCVKAVAYLLGGKSEWRDE